MKHRILKKFVKAYQPYGKDCKGVLLGIKEEGKYKYWHRGAHLTMVDAHKECSTKVCQTAS